MHAHIGVAFIGADHKAAGLGDGEVHPGEGGIRVKEFLAQMLPGSLCEFLGVVLPCFSADLFVKDIADLLFLEVNRRHNNVAWGLAEKLDDAFSQVGIDHINSFALKELVEVALFREDGFAFYELADIMLSQYGMNMFIVFLCIGGP